MRVDRGYSIPVIDLAGDRKRQYEVDREPGQYLGHPTTCVLDDAKTILCVYPKGHGRGAIVYKRSKDGGKTWSPRLPTPANWASSGECPTLYRLTDRNKKKRLILFSGLYPIRMALSDNDGLAFTELAPIGDYGGIVPMSSVTALKNGDHLAFFHDDGRFIANSRRVAKFKVYTVRSADGGLTWSAPVVIAEHRSAHLCEPGVIRSPDGNRLTILLRENSRRYNSMVVHSDDEGISWTEPIEVSGALTGDRHTAVYTRDGRLFIAFRDTALESKTHGDWVAWVGTYQDILAGNEGQYRIRLMDNKDGADCAYPGVVVLRDDTIVTTTYGHWNQGEEPFIMTVRLKLSETDKQFRAQLTLSL